MCDLTRSTQTGYSCEKKAAAGVVEELMFTLSELEFFADFQFAPTQKDQLIKKMLCRLDKSTHSFNSVLKDCLKELSFPDTSFMLKLIK